MALSERYHRLPSEIIHLNDSYVAFCFDEAVAYIQAQISYDKDGKFKWAKHPHWIDEPKIQSNIALVDIIQKKNNYKGG